MSTLTSLGARLVRGHDDDSRPPRLVLRFAVYSSVLLALAAGTILLYVRHAERGRAEKAAARETRVIADSLLDSARTTSAPSRARDACSRSTASSASGSWSMTSFAAISSTRAAGSCTRPTTG